MRVFCPAWISSMATHEDSCDDNCSVCLSCHRAIRFDCGHCVVCVQCAIILESRGDRCPICRARITRLLFAPEPPWQLAPYLSPHETALSRLQDAASDDQTRLVALRMLDITRCGESSELLGRLFGIVATDADSTMRVAAGSVIRLLPPRENGAALLAAAGGLDGLAALLSADKPREARACAAHVLASVDLPAVDDRAESVGATSRPADVDAVRGRGANGADGHDEPAGRLSTILSALHACRGQRGGELHRNASAALVRLGALDAAEAHESCDGDGEGTLRALRDCSLEAAPFIDAGDHLRAAEIYRTYAQDQAHLHPELDAVRPRQPPCAPRLAPPSSACAGAATYARARAGAAPALCVHCVPGQRQACVCVCMLGRR